MLTVVMALVIKHHVQFAFRFVHIEHKLLLITYCIDFGPLQLNIGQSTK